MFQTSKQLDWVKIRWAAALVLMLAVIPVFAQAPTGTILGVIKDSTGGSVAGAVVTVTNVDTSASRTVTTGEDGAYRVPALPVGNYQVQITKEGFQTVQRKGLTLEVDQQAAIDVTLQVGSTGQTITVTEEAPQVNTTSSTTGGLVSEQQVADLPLNGRNLVDLTLLQSGIVQSNVFSLTGTVGPTNIVGTTFSANGATIHSNNFVLDGAIQTSIMSMNASSMIGTTLGVDGVKEYKVVGSLAPAEYGLVMGATSTQVSKSGSNQWHGDAFEYIRNSSLDARNYFDALDTANFFGKGTDKSVAYPGKRIPPFQRNNFGGAFGGPIKKDKLFFWAVFEGLTQNLGITTSGINTLPAAGIVNGVAQLGCYDPVSHTVTSDVLNGAGQIVSASSFRNPACANLAAAAGSTPVPINTTTGACTGGPCQLNPVAMHFVQDSIFPGQAGVGFYPYPNTNICGPSGCPAGSNKINGAECDLAGCPLAGTNFTYAFPYTQPSREQFGQMRVDYTFSAKDSAFIRYTEDHATQDALRGYQQSQDHQLNDNIFITLAENHIFSPAVLNTLRYSFQRTNSLDNIYPTPDVTDPNVILSPYTTIGKGFTVCGCSWGVGTGVNGGITGYTGTGGADGTLIQNIYSYSDDLYYTKGKHAFKFGAVLNDYWEKQDTIFQQGGAISSSNPTLFAKGVWSSMNATSGTQYPYNLRYYKYDDIGFYAQDDMRATSRLTLNLGLRYEFSTVPRELTGNDWSIVDLIHADGGNATQGGVTSRMFQNPSLHAFSPRIGFAFDPFGNGKMAIRGGAGIYYDIGNWGSPMLEEACCTSPTAYQVTITNANSGQGINPAGKDGVVFGAAVPLPISTRGLGGNGFNGQFYGGGGLPANIDLTYLKNNFAGVAQPAPRNVDYFLKQPSMIQYNLTIDKQLPWSMALSVSYAGSRGYHLPVNVEGNFTVPLGTLPNGLPYYCYNSVNRGPDGYNAPLINGAADPHNDPQCANATKLGTGPFNPNPANSGLPLDPSEFLFRVNRTIASVNQYTDRSQSWYDALQVNLTKRVTHGLSFSEALTWQKMLDDGQSQQPGESNSIRTSEILVPHVDKGISGYDAAFNSRFNLIYHAPTINSDKFYAKPLNGWWFSTIISVQSGYAFEPTLSRAFTANAADTNRPDINPNYDPSKVILGQVNEWFDPTMYSIPVVGTHGNLGRDTLRAPGLRNVDASAVKDTKVKWLGEAGNIEFRFEVFNIANHPNFSIPSSGIWSPSGAGTPATFGLPTSCSAPVTVSGVATCYNPTIQPVGTVDPATGKTAATAAPKGVGSITATSNRSRQIQFALKVNF